MYSQLQGCTCHGDSCTRPGLQTCCLPGPPVSINKALALPFRSAEPYQLQTSQTSSHLRTTAGLNPSTRIVPEHLTPSISTGEFKGRATKKSKHKARYISHSRNPAAAAVLVPKPPLPPDRYAATEMDLEYPKPHHHAATHPCSAEQLSARRELFTSCETSETARSPPP